MRPIIFLDFDGVINTLRHNNGNEWPDWKKEIAFDGLRNYRVTVSPSLCARLSALQEHADFVWCTTWGDYANISLAPFLGFPGDWPVIGANLDGTASIQWKWHGVKDFLAEYPDRPFVWIDDDECQQPFVQRWIPTLSQPSLCIAPRYHTGLVPSQVEEIERFVRKFAV